MTFGSTVLYVDDVPSVLDFYRRAFGLETRFFDSEYQFATLKTDQDVGAALQVASHECGKRMMGNAYLRPADGQPCGVEVAFYTSDVAVAFARAVDAGAVPLSEPKVMPWGQTVGYVRSIEGTHIGLCTPIVPP